MSVPFDLSLAGRAEQFRKVIASSAVTGKDGSIYDLEAGLTSFGELLSAAHKNGQGVYLVGNGGSAGVAGHAATDFFNVAKLRAITLHESSLLTCMANDFGYENAFARMLSQMLLPGDVVIAISSSGKSMNIRNAAAAAAQKNCPVITLSGFAHDNPLRLMGDLNFWLDSNDYGHIEIGHQFILHNLSDRFGRGQIV